MTLSLPITAKGLYRRMDQMLGELHRRERGQGFFEAALHGLYEGFGVELGMRGARLFVKEGSLLEGLDHAGPLDELPDAPIALADLHGERVHLVADGHDAARPSAWFELPTAEKPYVFSFTFGLDWKREAAELVLNTACSILSVKLGEERLGATLRQAVEIQQSLLLAHPPDFPGFDLAARSVPAEEVGGDWFDFLDLGEGSLGIAIGDASGHGLPAALMARDVVIGLRMGIERELKAGHALEKLNRVLHKSTLSSCFVSLLYGELEENGSFFYYNAGHDAPLFVSDGGCQLLRTGGAVLGPLPEARFRRHFAHLDKGALLALYTDGLTERRSRSGELFGLERLQKILFEGRALPSAELVERCFAAVERFGAGGHAPDDETLVLVRRLAG